MDTICDFCGKIIPEDEICYGTKAGGTMCDNCLDDYCDLTPEEEIQDDELVVDCRINRK